MEIDIRGHIDCCGSNIDNSTLSNNCVQYTTKQIISKGTLAIRFTAKAYGESQLLNNCKCEADVTSLCSESEHKQEDLVNF